MSPLFRRYLYEGWCTIGNPAPRERKHAATIGQDSYAAVGIVRDGYCWNEPARHRLYLIDQYSPIIIQTGRQAGHESFEQLHAGILAVPLTLTEDKLVYTAPNSQRIDFWMCKDSVVAPYPKRLPLIDAQELDLDLQHNYKRPYLLNAVSSDAVTVTHGDRKWEYAFRK